MRLRALAKTGGPTMEMYRSFAKARRRVAGHLMLFFAALALGGCRVAHMALPHDLQGESSKLAVEGRSLSIFGKSIEFGRYRITDIHRGWTRGNSIGLSIGETEFRISDAKQKYEFSVRESDRATWEAQCATVADWSEFETQGFLGGRFGVEFSSNEQLVCNLKQAGGDKLSKLVLSQSLNKDTKLHGVMTDGVTRIDIAATHKLDSTPLQVSTPTGFIFHIEGRPVGAVEIFNKGTVWLNNSVTSETRSALAATSAVLLLYQSVKD